MVRPEIRTNRVAIYIRWSTDDQGDGTTLEVQMDGCKHYALSQGWQVNPDLIFIDDGYSGGSLDRPALTRLREAIAAGLVDCVVLFKIDRLSRNVVDTVNLVLREWEGRCHVKSAREAIDTTTQQGKMFFYTLVSFAEWERSVIKERTWSGRMRRLQEGKNPGFRPPYGLAVGESPGTFQAVPEEAAVVRHIFDLYNQGLGYKAIAVQLTEEGIRFRRGRPFSAQTVMQILQNPIYVGQLVYGRTARGRGEGAPTVVESAHLPQILEREHFELAQATRSQRAEARTPNRAVTSGHLLTGIIRCKRCGSAMMGRKKYGGGYQVPYYICVGQRNKGKQFCDAGYIRQEDVDRWVVERLTDRYSGVTGTESLLADALQAIDREAEASAERLSAVQRDLGGLQRELAVIGRDYRQERLSLQDYLEQKAEVGRERTRLTREAEQLEANLKRLSERRALHRNRVGRINLVQQWPSLGLAERKLVLRGLIHSLAIYREPASHKIDYDLVWVTDQATRGTSAKLLSATNSPAQTGNGPTL